jgi:cysteine-rich repeat protein
MRLPPLLLGLAVVVSARYAAAFLTGFPVPVRGWETIPGVVPADGVATFRLEVDVNGPVAGVQLVGVSRCLDPTTADTLPLRDDGRDGDRIAGDAIFTSPAFRYTCAAPDHLRSDPSSPTGVDFLDVGTVQVQELDGSVSAFLEPPAVGLLAPDVPPARTLTLSPDVVVTPHLINVRSDTHATQRFLRFADDALVALTTRIYAVLPDAYDFLIFFSTDKVERLPAVFNRNFVAGSHRSVHVSFTGTGQPAVDDRALYGSKSRLQGVNALDAYGRGIVANVVTHELSHQWVAYLDPALGLSDGIHYGPLADTASLVGGFRWIDVGENTSILDCTEGRSGAHHAPPLDRYMMGLIDAGSVGPLHVAAGPTLDCGEPIGAVARTVTIADIQASAGPRVPGPAGAQRDFTLAFVAESRGRLLDPNEMTFYEILAAHYTAPIPPSDPDPYHGSGQWPSVVRFFEGTTWRGDVTTCGNGTVEGDEECDDGNTTAGDGCSPTCRRETGDIVLPATLGALPALNPRSNGMLVVPVLATAAFAPASIDVRTVRFGATGTEAAPIGSGLRDVDRDGDVDLELRFRSRDTRLGCGSTEAVLTGRTAAGVPFLGRAPVTLLGCK